MAAIAVAFTVVGALAVWNLRPAPPSRAPIVRFSLIPPDGVSTLRSQVLAISPDGTHVAYASNGQLFLHSMPDGDDRPIPGTDLDVMAPFFSPDGQWVGFFSFSDSTLKKIAVTGGIAVTICKSEPPSGAHWYGDQIVYAQANLGIVRVSANGGVPQVIIPSKPPEAFAVPQVLNNGRDVLFSHATETGADRWDKARVVVHSLESGARKVVFEGGSGARYVPSGHLVYLVGATLFALPFDLANLAVKAGPVPVVDEIRRSGAAGIGTGTANYAISDDGSLVYHVGAQQVRGVGSGGQRLVFVDRSGQAEPLDLPVQPYYHPRVSPDGSRLAFGTDDGREAIIWIYELRGGAPPRRLTFDGRNVAPIWTPDGRRVTFQSNRQGTLEIFSQSADGSGTSELLFKGDPIVQYVPQAWHPTENILSFWSLPRGADLRRGRVSTLRAGGNQPMPLVNDPEVGQRFSSFSPDGRWITYTSNPIAGLAASGDIFVEPFPPTGAKYQLSVDGGRESLWSPDGKQIFYRHTRSNRLMAVDVRIAGTPTFGNPFTLPIGPPIFAGAGRNFDIAPDGKRFIVVSSPTAASTETSKEPEQRLNVVPQLDRGTEGEGATAVTGRL
jgi:serine/threonine-protein kinase